MVAGHEEEKRGKQRREKRYTAEQIPEQATSIRSIRSLAPLLDRVLVQRVKAETKTASGIFLPEASVEKLNEAKVLAVGPGALDKKGNRLPMGVAIGDRVLIPQVCHTINKSPSASLRPCIRLSSSSFACSLRYHRVKGRR